MKRLPLTPEERLIWKAKQSVAWAAVRSARSKGWLVPPDVCEECGKKPRATKKWGAVLEAAHYSYDRPLDVRWLCRACHSQWDSARTKGKTDIESFVPMQIGALLVKANRGEWDEDCGYSFRAFRRAVGMTQAQLAQASGLSQSTISNIESGASNSVSVTSTASAVDDLGKRYSSGKIYGFREESLLEKLKEKS